MSVILEFHPEISAIYADEDDSIKSPPYGTIDALMQSLKDNGPLVVDAAVGPNAYTEAPFKLKDRVNEIDVYGWTPGTRKEYSEGVSAILCGARKAGEKAHVYFRLAKDITGNENSLIRGYVPSTDEKVYVMSYDTFLNRALHNLYPVCKEGSWLYSLDADQALGDKALRMECNRIGQTIFDRYKQIGGDTDAAREAVQRICLAAKFLGNRDSLLHKSIEYAWDGIGDSLWRWAP